MATTAYQAHKQINQRRAINAALNNEQVTRERVTHLETGSLILHQRLSDAEGILERRFWGRLRWLLTGK